MPESAVVYANNNVVLLAWHYDAPIANCLGFSIHRYDKSDAAHPVALPSWIGFTGQDNLQWQRKSTDIWPIQEYRWNDFSALPGATYRYQIIPMTGSPENLQPKTDQALTTDWVTLTPACGNHFAAYFNNGILSTQFVAHQLDALGGAPQTSLLAAIGQVGNPLRDDLAGQSIDALKMLLERIDNGPDAHGKCYCALYELSDPELLDALIAHKDRVNIILSNTGPKDDVNKAGRQKLKDAGVAVIDRMLSNGHIGHNKFVVYVDSVGMPKGVLTGSTNWTPTGLCGQSNNQLLIEDADIAKQYLDFWNRLKTDTGDAAGAAELQGQQLRQSNEQARTVGASTLWFSPNTRQKTKPAHGTPVVPPDMADIFERMHQAKDAIFFLAFQPGHPSIVDCAAACADANPNLLIRGAVSAAAALPTGDVQLHNSANDLRIVVATEIKDQFASWEKELLTVGYAIIHDKIIVIDPLSPDCTVIAGSHNLGYRASYSNDENLIVIQGNQALAIAYAVHVMDVYGHYRFRSERARHGQGATTGFSGYLDTTDAWQQKMLAQPNQEQTYWIGNGQVKLANHS